MVDSNQGLLDALSRCLGETTDLVVTGTCRSLDLAVSEGLLDASDVLMLGFGAQTLLQVLSDTSREHPDLGIVLVADAEEEPRILDAIASGAKGWVTLNDGLDELLAALREVSRGEPYFPTEALRALLVSRLDDRGRATTLSTRRLTQRESDVLACLATGMTRQEVGLALELSDNTVRTYVRRILRKLHVRSAAAAIAVSQEMETTHG